MKHPTKTSFFIFWGWSTQRWGRISVPGNKSGVLHIGPLAFYWGQTPSARKSIKKLSIEKLSLDKIINKELK